MMKLTFALRQVAAAAVVAAIALGCGELTPGSENLAGSYLPSVFLITPTGKPQIDVLLQGGTLNIAITASNTTSGQLSLPASVTGTTPLLALMTGDAVVTGSTLQFQQAADTFIRNLTWTVKRDTLEAVNQVVGGATYTIRMPKH
jgi:hypothetical protein